MQNLYPWGNRDIYPFLPQKGPKGAKTAYLSTINDWNTQIISDMLFHIRDSIVTSILTILEYLTHFWVHHGSKEGQNQAKGGQNPKIDNIDANNAVIRIQMYLICRINW